MRAISVAERTLALKSSVAASTAAAALLGDGAARLVSSRHSLSHATPAPGAAGAAGNTNNASSSEAAAAVSCAAACGGYAVDKTTKRGCWCDAACSVHGDCCADNCAVCGYCDTHDVGPRRFSATRPFNETTTRGSANATAPPPLPRNDTAAAPPPAVANVDVGAGGDLRAGGGGALPGDPGVRDAERGGDYVIDDAALDAVDDAAWLAAFEGSRRADHPFPHEQEEDDARLRRRISSLRRRTLAVRARAAQYYEAQGHPDKVENLERLLDKHRKVRPNDPEAFLDALEKKYGAPVPPLVLPAGTGEAAFFAPHPPADGRETVSVDIGTFTYVKSVIARDAFPGAGCQVPGAGAGAAATTGTTTSPTPPLLSPLLLY